MGGGGVGGCVLYIDRTRSFTSIYMELPIAALVHYLGHFSFRFLICEGKAKSNYKDMQENSLTGIRDLQQESW